MRKITFTIPGIPEVEIMATEQADGTLLFEVTVLSTDDVTGDLRGLFFDVADISLVGNLAVSGLDVTDQDTGGDVINLGQGVNMNGASDGYDAGVEFGTAGSAKDYITSTSFVLSATDGTALTLDDIAHMEFGARLTGIGDPDDPNSWTGSAKNTVIAPAAPDAIDDEATTLEDTSILIDVVGNDTDADGDTLTIIAVSDPAHGTAEIVGNQIRYTPDLNYGGDSDSFTYTIDDGNGGCDTATVTVNVTAVADAPSLSVTASAGATAQQVVLTIDSALFDTDGSESLQIVIDETTLGTGATLSQSVFDNPAGPVQVILTLPDGMSSDFALKIDAISTEASNGDSATTTVNFDIDAAYGVLSEQIALTAEDQNMWAPGGEFVYDPSIPFLGVDIGPNGGTWGGDVVGGSWNYDIKVGFQQTLELNGGSFDATVPYDVSVDAFYNMTTDMLELDPLVMLAAGGGFVTDGPSLAYTLDLLFKLGLGASVAIAGEDIFSPNFSLDRSLSLIDYDSDTSPPFQLGDEDDALSATLQWPTLETSGGDGDGDGTYTSSGQSLNALTLNLDADQTIADLFFGGANVFDLGFDSFSDFFQTGVRANLEILDLDLTLGMNFLQSFALDTDTILADIIFENGDIFDFDLGSATTYADASQYDLNGDGIIEFELAFDDMGTTFSNDTDLNLNAGYSLELLSGGYKAGILGAVVEDSFGPVFKTTGATDVAQFGVFDTAFAVDLIGDSTDVFMIG